MEFDDKTRSTACANRAVERLATVHNYDFDLPQCGLKSLPELAPARWDEKSGRFVYVEPDHDE